VAPVYEDGEKTVTLKGERIAEEFQELVEQYVRALSRSVTNEQLPHGSASPARGHHAAAHTRPQQLLAQLSSAWS